MPKKFATENSKAVAARERKKNAKEVETAKKQKAVEDAYWQDNDKQVIKKQQRKEEQEKKKQQQLEKKAEAKALLEKELNSIKPSKAVPPPQKITRSQISVKIAESTTNKKEEKKTETHLDLPLQENINRLTIDGEEARTVSEAIAVLSSKDDPDDKHPEKRMKAAYTAYEERRLKELKIEHPSLRLSQLKQMIFKEWQKSPENPLNKV